MKKLIPFTFLVFILLFNPLLYSQTGWVNRNPTPQNDFYAIKFFDQNTGYTVGSNGVILKNTSGSNNWITLNSGTNNDLYGLYFFDVNHGYVVGVNGLILSTTNGGNNWINIASGTGNALKSIAFVDNNTGFICGDNGIILKSINGGVNWTTNYNASFNLNSIFFLDLNTGFIAGDHGLLLKTVNGGSVWNIQMVDSSSIKSVYFINSNTGFLVAAGPSSYSNAYRSTDGGSTWNVISFFRMESNWHSIDFINQRTGFIGGENNLIMKTTNFGANWYEMGVPARTILNCINITDTLGIACGTNGWITKFSVNDYINVIGGSKENFPSLSFSDINTGIVISNNLNMRTQNGGSNWQLNRFGEVAWEEGCAIILTYLKFFSQSAVYRVVEDVSCHGGPSFYSMDNSTDGGITWNGNRGFYQTNVGIPSICEAEGVTYIVADYAPTGVYKNSGNGWNNVYPTSSNSLGSLSFANANTGIVLFGNYPNYGYLRTTTGGTQWSNVITGTKSLYDIKLLPSGIGYLAGDSSFFERTTDFGNSWTLRPSSYTGNFMQMQFVNDNTGWILTSGGPYWYSTKMFYTNNGGFNYVQLQSLGNANPKAMSFLNSLTGYVCGDSGVVLKTTDAGLTFINPISSLNPGKFSMYQNYPNPFNPTTNIKFDLPKSGFVKLTIYDALGREVTTLVNSEMKAGSYNADWDASNFSSGIYFYKLKSGDYFQTKKMVLIK